MANTFIAPARRTRRASLAVRLAVGATVTTLGLAGLTACGSDDDSTASDSTSASADGMPSGGPGDGEAPGDGGGMGGSTTCEADDTDTISASTPDADTTEVTAEAVDAANALIALLDDDQVTEVTQDFADLSTKECSWSNFPDGLFSGRVGLRMGDLSDAQQEAVMAILETVLSDQGLEYFTAQQGSEETLSSGEDDTTYGTANYHIAFYGDPSTDDAWAIQFGGHHLGIMVTVGDGALSVTPYFKGVQPIEYTNEDGESVEAMGDLADNFFALFTSMDDDTLAAAELSGTYDQLVMGPQSDTDYPDTEGVAYGDLTEEEQELVWSVIEGYVDDYDEDLAQPLLDLYESQLEDTYVSWSGQVDQDTTGSYLRIDGPRVWIEWANVDNPGESGIHLHTIYRDKELDYGTGTSS
ncbi:DUF3500 domain-containing protein [Nocardioides bruguierae]|uniref:DUF3500 domain-containing protein n=1 Tax=Nocardioides bruguierae TaxID=2945102 RepID=A0A9X2IGB1_9ACTN|nr:DUF3500 domain-containing protein [Nocardioides bruguierae]MCM0621384.1 DUF3500 domain-containing protein [Nocardioides bruguierae]